jgi:M6 family metalloprotease-like protein
MIMEPREKRDNLFRSAGRVLLIALVFGQLHVASAAPLSFVPQKLIQPDGSVLHCFASGDEFYNWLHDNDGFTIIQHPTTGFYVYALKMKGRLVPSRLIAGRSDPAAEGFQKWLNISPDEMQVERQRMVQLTPPDAGHAPRTGSINNIVVFIRFSDESEFTDASSTYDAMFNDAVAGENSMYNYFQEASYGVLSVTSTFYPLSGGSTVVSYQDSHSRGYFQPYNSTTNPIGYTGGNNGTERRDREHQLLVDAVNSISSEVSSGLDIDADGDGRVDNVCFIIYGDPTGWSSLLWPHRWALYSQSVYINGKRVYDYNFQLQEHLLPRNASVLCHEMFHSLGAPDLYHYSSQPVTPVGQWDVMASNTNPPQHMTAFMKYRYGDWISSIPVISSPGTFALNPLTSSSGNCYRINSPNTSSEYFDVEYRKRTTTFEGGIPAEGLLVYRINTAVDGEGNADGPPDEVYVFRPGGTTGVNGSLGSAPFSQESGRVAFHDESDPSCFLADGSMGGIHVYDVGTMGGTIQFSLGPPLPIQLADFNAMRLPDQTVLLYWSTVSETNNYGFEVLRCHESSGAYETVPNSFVRGNGTTIEPQTYSYRDTSGTGQTYYRLKQIDLDGSCHLTEAIAVNIPTGVEEETPAEFSLSQNYPNPFNPTTQVSFSVEMTGHATLDVFDYLGRRVTRLFEGHAESHRMYRLTFDARDLSAGVYVYVLTSGWKRDVKRAILLR